ncbi:MAG TPA: thymidine phosphorylase [Bdellovibrionales bacterium]|nr:thymidine phosphorylase [Bdellovibrionales bacterium]
MALIPAELIKKKRDRGALTRDEILFLINGYAGGAIPDYQMSAWLMAVVLNGMNDEETHHLTQAMLHSGDVLDFSYLKPAKVDKHSTGGVGDKTSLILAPIVAACGVAVPMISGRGLGHTGGTLDKLESIPGFVTRLPEDKFKAFVEKYGLCFMGQTERICPADKKIYALRDVTGTVESIPLICASIMSKKLAEGIDALVLDVKFGSGAFMKTLPDAEKLARNLISIGEKGGKRVRALLTNMEQPLGAYVGNALEVEECVRIMKNEKSPEWSDTRELSLELSAHMLALGGAASNIEDARKLAEAQLSNGKALEKFETISAAHGGDLKALPKPSRDAVVEAPSDGYVTAFQNEQVGLASLLIGAGRIKASDVIDPVAGLKVHVKIGHKVSKGQPLFTLYGSAQTKFDDARARLLRSVELRHEKPQSAPLIAKIL